MRYSIAAGLLASGAAAFSDSSPFLLYSKAKLPNLPPNPSQLQSTASVLATTHAILSACPTRNYLLLAHPNAHASDLRDPATGACLAPNLCGRALSGANGTQTASALGVAEVVGPAVSGQDLQALIEASCGDVGAAVVLAQLDALPPTPGGARAEAVRSADRRVGELLDSREQVWAAARDDYTVVYFASPHEPPRRYEAEFSVGGAEAPLELRKREWDARADDGGKVDSTAPLFVKYQFFTPGIFMGFVGGLIMLAMLYVGLSAVASLQVSYGAFDKEMGPAAQKKQQ